NPTIANMLPINAVTNAGENPASQAVSEGDLQLDSLAALFREHYKGIFRVAYRITGSESDAEDALQTIFVRLTPVWTGRDLQPNPRAFLYRAAINASLDIVRRRRRVNSVPLDVVDFGQTPNLSVPSPADDHADME